MRSGVVPFTSDYTIDLVCTIILSKTIRVGMIDGDHLVSFVRQQSTDNGEVPKSVKLGPELWH